MQTRASNEPAQPSLGPGARELASDARELVRTRQVSKLFVLQARAPLVVRAVDDVSLSIPKGQTVGLVGESGCGKSTLGRLVLRLLEPTYGRISFEGQDITQKSERELRPLRKRMQLLFEDAAGSLNARLRVRDVIAEPLRIHRVCRDAREEQARVAGLIERVGLSPVLLERRARELSPGQCQQVAIARALALGPSFIVCDEALHTLDSPVQAMLVELLQSLQSEQGLSYLFISHDLRLVLRSSQRVHVMYAGRIVESASAEEVWRHSQHPYTRALFSAVPNLDPKRRRLRLLLEGEPPNASALPSGCAFHPRCPRARPGQCDREVPPLAPAGAASRSEQRRVEHEVACWFPHL